MRLIWLSTVPMTPARPYNSPPLRAFTQLATGVRTLTLEMLVPSTVTSGMVVVFGYVDSTGTSRQLTTNVLQSSTATWTNVSAYPGYSAVKFSVVTPYQVAANTEVSCQVRLISQAGVLARLYLDPEFKVA